MWERQGIFFRNDTALETILNHPYTYRQVRYSITSAIAEITESPMTEYPVRYTVLTLVPGVRVRRLTASSQACCTYLSQDPKLGDGCHSMNGR